MKLWLISQTKNTGYDTYDSAVVAAENETSARQTHPSNDCFWKDGKIYSRYYDGSSFLEDYSYDWVSNLDDVTVEYLGEAKEGTEAGVICASYNAG